MLINTLIGRDTPRLNILQAEDEIQRLQGSCRCLITMMIEGNIEKIVIQGFSARLENTVGRAPSASDNVAATLGELHEDIVQYLGSKGYDKDFLLFLKSYRLNGKAKQTKK